MSEYIDQLKINNCKSTHGRFNLDNGNVVIEVDVELNTKEIKKDIAIKVENLVKNAPELLEAAEELLEIKDNWRSVEEIKKANKLEKIAAKAKGEDG